MIEYHKISAPFKRDDTGSKKLLEGVFIDETVEFLKDQQWQCTEKIDGINIGIVWDGHRVVCQGRTENAQIPSKLMNKLLKLFGTNECEELFEQKFGEMPVVLFGEGYGAGIQKGGGNYCNDVSFILFDVYLPNDQMFLKRESVEDIAKAFSVYCVPIILTGTLQEAIDYVKQKPKSTIGTANMEGLVCRPVVELRDRRGRRVITKIKVKDFAV